MNKLTVIAELHYDDAIIHGDDSDAYTWFINDVLGNRTGELTIHSKEIGDTVGIIKVEQILTSTTPPPQT